MKHKTLRCTAETAALLLTVAMLAFLIAGLHQHDPDRVLSTLTTGWYQLTDGVRREIAFPVTLPAEPGQTLTLYNDTLTARDAGKLLSVRGGLMSVNPGQMEAGRSLGLNYAQTMRLIVIPQAIKNILPALGNEMITLLKDTSLVSVIALRDVTKQAQNIVSNTYQAYVPYVSLAIIYLVLVIILTKLLGIFERRLRESDRR